MGKPVGSDVREGKKTLYYARLMASASPQEKERLGRIFGNPACTAEDLDYVRTRALSVRQGIEALIADLEEKARAMIAGLSRGAPEDRQVLLGLLDFTTARRQ